jgi:hypothetical protein
MMRAYCASPYDASLREKSLRIAEENHPEAGRMWAFPIVAGSVVALASILVLAGWLLDIGMLKSVFSSWVSM